MRLYFVRHGESEANVLRQISNRGMIHPLTEKGVHQAKTLAHRLSADLLAGGIRQIYTSPLLRAVQTAEILAQVLNLPVEAADALREFDCGICEGRADEEAWASHGKVREDWFVRGLTDSRIEGGESLNDIRARFLPFIQALVDRQEDVLLVSHGGTLLAVLPDMLVNIDRPFAASHGMGNTDFIVAEQGGQGLVCIEWCGLPLS